MNDKNQRLFLAIALWLSVYFAYMAFFGPKKPAQTAPAASPSEAVAPKTPEAPVSPPPATPAADVPRETTHVPVRTANLDTPRAHLVATSAGGALESIQLLGDKWTRH